MKKELGKIEKYETYEVWKFLFGSNQFIQMYGSYNNQTKACEVRNILNHQLEELKLDKKVIFRIIKQTRESIDDSFVERTMKEKNIKLYHE